MVLEAIREAMGHDDMKSFISKHLLLECKALL